MMYRLLVLMALGAQLLLGQNQKLVFGKHSFADKLKFKFEAVIGASKDYFISLEGKEIVFRAFDGAETGRVKSGQVDGIFSTSINNRLWILSQPTVSYDQKRILFITYCGESQNPKPCRVYESDRIGVTKLILKIGDLLSVSNIPGRLKITLLGHKVVPSPTSQNFFLSMEGTREGSSTVEKGIFEVGPISARRVVSWSFDHQTQPSHLAINLAGELYTTVLNGDSGSSSRLIKVSGKEEVLLTSVGAGNTWVPFIDPTSSKVLAFRGPRVGQVETKEVHPNIREIQSLEFPFVASTILSNGLQVFAYLQRPWTDVLPPMMYDGIGIIDPISGEPLSLVRADEVVAERIIGFRYSLGPHRDGLVATAVGQSGDVSYSIRPLFFRGAEEKDGTTITLPGSFPGLTRENLQVFANGVRIYPDFIGNFSKVSESEIVFRPPATVGGKTEFKLALNHLLGRVETVNSVTLDLPILTPTFEVSVSKNLVNIGEEVVLSWRSNLPGRIASFRAIPPAVIIGIGPFCVSENCPLSTGWQMGFTVNISTTYSLEFVAGNGSRLSAEVRVEVRPPQIGSVAGIGGEKIRPGDWVEIYGQSFSEELVADVGDDFSRSPIVLGDIRVIWGKEEEGKEPQFFTSQVYYVSPSVLTVRVPEEVVPGNLRLYVLRGSEPSEPFEVSVEAPEVQTESSFRRGKSPP